MLTWFYTRCILTVMLCIYCSHPTQVVNSRHQKRLNHVWRRRQCTECHTIFTTNERPDLEQALSVRYRGQLIAFSRETLLISMYDSLKHRPTAVADATGLTTTVISQMNAYINDGIIERADIVTMVMTVLRRFDTTAATIYNAFHPKVYKD